jgi:RHH-type transcriptional regulator, rel operon repressor / antitoxin RelB
MLAVRIPENLEIALEKASAEDERPKSYFVRKALERYLEDREDYKRAIKVLKESDGEYVSFEEVVKSCGLEDQI